MNIKRINDILEGTEVPDNTELLIVCQFLWGEVQKLKDGISGHDHDGVYAEIDHEHDEYAKKDHLHSVMLE